MRFTYAIAETKLGWMAVGGSEAGLKLVTLPKPSREAVRLAVGDLMRDAVEDASAFGDLSYRLRRYFDGEKVTFSDALDLASATQFQRAVWNAARSIPYGETRSYGWVARQIGSPRACRAVGGAMARNHFPIIVPCHRVVASDGTLCGFGGGLQMKEQILSLETRGS